MESFSAKSIEEHQIPVSSSHEFIIGLVLAFSSSAFIGTSFILTKKGLLKLSHRAGEYAIFDCNCTVYMFSSM